MSHKPQDGPIAIPDFEGRDRLSPRMCQVLAYGCNGYTAKETAQVLGTSHRTVERQREKVYERLKVSNMLEAAVRVYAGN